MFSEILKGADLSVLTAKKVRLQLQKKLDCDLLSRKEEIDTLTMKFVNEQENNDSSDKSSDSESLESEPEEKKPSRKRAATKRSSKEKAKIAKKVYNK